MRVDVIDRPHALVAGAGFAGAAAASRLAEAGVAVTLVEEKATMGGRTTSFRDGVTRQEVDNGQHLFLGAYAETRRFLRRLGVEDRVKFDKEIVVPMYSRSKGRSPLRLGARGGAPALVANLFLYRELHLKDKFSLLYGLAAIKLARQPVEPNQSVTQWLSRLKQTRGARRAFWDPLCYATLNERPDLASAAAMANVMREGFLGSSDDRALGYATLPLGKLWAVELAAYLRSRGGLVANKQRVTGFVEDNGRVKAAWVDGTSVEADVFVSALPFPAFKAVASESMRPAVGALKTVDHSPIAAVNLWFDEPPFVDPIVGFLDMDVQWAFNRSKLWTTGAAGQISMVFSAARAHQSLTSAELIKIAMDDLRRAFPRLKEEPRHATVTWEREATPSPTPGFWLSRPGVETPLANFFIAGDWVNTGLPPTIEAACRSGHRAAERALEHLKLPVSVGGGR